jgi:hypothetical protein
MSNETNQNPEREERRQKKIALLFKMAYQTAQSTDPENLERELKKDFLNAQDHLNSYGKVSFRDVEHYVLGLSEEDLAELDHARKQHQSGAALSL